MTKKETNLYTITRNREPNMDLMAKAFINLYYMNKEAQKKKKEK